MTRTAVVARTAEEAQNLAVMLGMPPRTACLSVRSRLRGFVLNAIIIDSSALPLTDELRGDLQSATMASGGPIFTIERLQL